MNKEELIGKLQMVYVGDRNALNELIGYYDGLKEVIEIVKQENKELKRQLEYLRSGEYLNQLKFERNLLESIVQDYEIPKEDKEFIDMTHRNTELLEQINKAIEYIKDSYVEVLKYYDEPSETASYELVTIDLLKILGGDVDNE